MLGTRCLRARAVLYHNASSCEVEDLSQATPEHGGTVMTLDQFSALPALGAADTAKADVSRRSGLPWLRGYAHFIGIISESDWGLPNQSLPGTSEPVSVPA
jgi:hypothetical protein